MPDKEGAASPFATEIAALVKKEKIPLFVADILRKFQISYGNAALKNGVPAEEIEPLLLQLLQFAVKQISHPYRFEPFHKKIISPFNYYQFGLDFIRPLVNIKHSKAFGKEMFDKIAEQLANGENVILVANHQIEPDPQVISLLLESTHPKLAEEIIFVAGHRVVTDPLAVPFSLGRNLLCIYSKKHVEHPPEQKAEKLMHNQRTLKKMQQLLSEGGKCIYVALSGGRDRPDEKGRLLPARFDPQSVELFSLMAKQSKKPTHFYPLALLTYHILPPPNTVEKEIGEKRHAHYAPVFLSCGPEIDFGAIEPDGQDKIERRKKRADHMWQQVMDRYLELEKELFH